MHYYQFLTSSFLLLNTALFNAAQLSIPVASSNFVLILCGHTLPFCYNMSYSFLSINLILMHTSFLWGSCFNYQFLWDHALILHSFWDFSFWLQLSIPQSGFSVQLIQSGGCFSIHTRVWEREKKQQTNKQNMRRGERMHSRQTDKIREAADPTCVVWQILSLENKNSTRILRAGYGSS